MIVTVNSPSFGVLCLGEKTVENWRLDFGIVHLEPPGRLRAGDRMVALRSDVRTFRLFSIGKTERPFEVGRGAGLPADGMPLAPGLYRLTLDLAGTPTTIEFDAVGGSEVLVELP